MERDGFTTSIWQESLNSYAPSSRFSNNTVFDVLIVGGGVTGLATALALQKENLKCLLIESHEIGFGTSAGTTAHINTILEKSYHDIAKDFSEETAAMVASAVQDSIYMIRKNVSAYQIDCDFSMQPGYLYSTNADQTEILDQMVSKSAKLGVEAEYTGGMKFPVFYEKMALFSNQAQYHPVKYLHGLAAEFERSGGIIVQHCRAIKHEKNEHIQVNTTVGNITARQVVYATHTPPGVNILHTLIAPYRSYVIAAELQEGETYPGGFVYDLEEPYHYLRLQHLENKTFLVCGGEDHKTGNFVNTEEPYQRLEAFLRKSFSTKEIAFRWSSQFYESADGLAYIGEMPGEGEKIYVATGFGGNGMIYGHMSAIILKELILNQESKYGEIFSPKRVKPIASFSKFVKENADVVRELISGILPRDKFDAEFELGPDEARIVEYEGKKTGVYRDPSGNLYAVNPICPHMKCVVEWNSTEKSWDCPCHGSRFSYTGEMLTGPSRHDLKTISIMTSKP